MLHLMCKADKLYVAYIQEYCKNCRIWQNKVKGIKFFEQKCKIMMNQAGWT